jgi:Asp-tRNA(Asn)/Glu-tRNA(Gln) amidotransferase A subunit family amidase
VILGKTVTTEFAATEPGPTRNPWDLARTPGGSSSGSAAGVAAGFISAGLGTQVVGSILRPASYCGVVGFKPTFGALNRGGSHDYMSQSCQGVIAATIADTWAVAREIGTRAGGDPGFPGLYGPDTQPPPKKPRAIVLLETAGWADASAQARAQLALARDRLAKAGITLRTRSTDAQVAAVEEAIARSLPLTRLINTWESRWPLNTYRDRDAAKLSAAMRDRVREAEALNLEAYRAAIAERAQVRGLYAALTQIADACLTLTAPDAAPLGLRSTGNPVFVVPGSLLGVPALSLPLLEAGGLPLGLQLLGFEHRDADLFATAAAVEQIVGNDHGVRA